MAELVRPLKELMKPGQVVAVIDDVVKLRDDILRELRKHRVGVIELTFFADLEQHYNVGAIIYGLREIRELAAIVPACEKATTMGVPMVIMPTSALISFRILDQVYKRYSLDHGPIPVEIVPGRYPERAIELLAEGLFDMKRGVSKIHKI